MDTNARTDIIPSAVKALVNLIPYAGGSISSIISDYQSDRKEKKLKEFLDSIIMRLQQNEEKLSRISHEYILNDDFFDIFENSLRRVIFERQQEKRLAYSNILANSIISEASYDETEMFQHLVDILTPLHIHILREFTRHSLKQGEDYKVFHNRVLLAVLPFANNKYDLLLESIGDLESRNLSQTFLAAFAVFNKSMGMVNFTDQFVTEKGKRLIMFIS